MSLYSDPLLDSQFLYDLDQYRNKIIYARITSLTTENYPNERIEGVATAGSIQLDGNSAVRRVCSLTLVTNQLNINNIYWGLSTRIKVEIGIKNEIQEDYPDIIWFPQGIFILTDFKPSAKVNSYSIKITAKDKMCLLNGDIGGNFNAETQLDVERIQNEDGSFTDEKRSIAYIIREMVHYYAQENFHNIIIEDIDMLSLKMLTNNTVDNIYLIKDINTEEICDIASSGILLSKNQYKYQDLPDLYVNFSHLINNFRFYSGSGEDSSNLINIENLPTYIINENGTNTYVVYCIEPGEDLGYEITETYYPEELIAGVGETVTSVLDKIIKMFGAYEYFYNLEGQFVFRAKQTYVNSSWNNMIKIDDDENKNYIAPFKVSSLVKYNFEGSRLVTTYSNNPQLGKIKNDFTVWGKRKLASGEEIPIHMRYAIDKKPDFYENFEHQRFISDTFYNYTVKNNYKYIDNGNNTIFLSDELYKIVDWREIIYQMAKDYYKHNHEDEFEITIQYNNNKTFIRENDNLIISYKPYEQGKTKYEQYYTDLEGFWRGLYLPEDEIDNIKITDKNNLQIIDKNNFYKDIQDPNDENKTIKTYVGPWNRNIIENPSSLLFWFDFFDAESLGLGQFSVPAIGDRPKNSNNDNIKAIIYKDVPNVILIKEEDKNIYESTGRLLTGYSYIIRNATLDSYFEDQKIRISTRGITAQESIDDLLYQNAYCNEQINIQSIPIYYLEPNTIISARDENRGVHGYYIINKITIPLSYKGTMKITAIKVPERVY